MLYRAKLGMAMFLLSEAVFFFMLIVAFVYLRDSTVSAAARGLNVGTTGFFTACLLASSFTMWRAVASAARERSAGLRLWLGGTILLGSAFLYGQASEYLRLFHQNITISQGMFGTTFFTLTAFHGLHVLAGIVLLAILLVLVWAGDTGQPSSTAVQTLALYWYFVDLVWIAIFAIVYLWALL